MTTISRDRTSGKLLLNGTPTVLRGGHYDPFFDPGRSREAYTNADGTVHNVAYPRGSNPCQPGSDSGLTLGVATWTEGGGEFELFDAMQQTRCNFVRIWLTGGVLYRGGQPVSPSPFIRVPHGAGYLYDVKGAVLRGNWNQPYFDRLREFVADADRAGVVVQITFFNYFDLVPDGAGPLKTWNQSFWNVGTNLEQGWARDHLLAPDTPPGRRQELFITPENGLRAVQQEIIGKVMKEVAPFRNVILEVMNEPHQINDAADVARAAEFSSYMTGLMYRYRQSLGSQTLFSINASFVFPGDGSAPGKSDVQVWKEQGLPHYSQVDAVSYHGMTAMGTHFFEGKGCSGANVRAPRVDTASVDARADRHRAAHPDKACIFCTDAVRIDQFEHFYNNRRLDMHVRDGQIMVFPENDSLEAQLLHSRPFNWAARVFVRGGGAETGRLHFQNHSTFRRALEQIGNAAKNVGLEAAPEPVLAEL